MLANALLLHRPPDVVKRTNIFSEDSHVAYQVKGKDL